MSHPTYFAELLETVRHYGGDAVVEIFEEVKGARERHLASEWKTIPNTDVSESTSSTLFQMMDIDSLLSVAKDHLPDDDYSRFLLDAGKILFKASKYQLVQHLMQEILIRTDEIDDEIVERAYIRMGLTKFYQNAFEAAHPYYQKALDLAASNHHDKILIRAKKCQGNCFMEQGEVREGESAYTEALKLAQKTGDEQAQCGLLLNLANAYAIQDKPKEAIDSYQKALQLARTTGNRDAEMRIHHSMGVSLKNSGEADRALACFEQSLAISEELHHTYMIAISFLERAESYVLLKDARTALSYNTSAFQMFSEMGDRLGLADAYKVFGMIDAIKDHHNTAEAFFKNSLKISEDMQSALRLGETSLQLGKFYTSTGRKDEARERFTQARAAYEQLNNDHKVKEIIRELKTLS